MSHWRRHYTSIHLSDPEVGHCGLLPRRLCLAAVEWPGTGAGLGAGAGARLLGGRLVTRPGGGAGRLKQHREPVNREYQTIAIVDDVNLKTSSESNWQLNVEYPIQSSGQRPSNRSKQAIKLVNKMLKKEPN